MLTQELNAKYKKRANEHQHMKLSQSHEPSLLRNSRTSFFQVEGSDVERVTNTFLAWLGQKKMDRELTITFDPGIVMGRTTYQS
ncbi:hypothetical protein PJO48_29660, partial [Mycobacterium kansasii]